MAVPLKPLPLCVVPAESTAAVELDMQEKLQTLSLTIEALKAQLEDQARLSKEEVCRASR